MTSNALFEIKYNEATGYLKYYAKQLPLIIVLVVALYFKVMYLKVRDYPDLPLEYIIYAFIVMLTVGPILYALRLRGDKKIIAYTNKIEFYNDGKLIANYDRIQLTNVTFSYSFPAPFLTLTIRGQKSLKIYKYTLPNDFDRLAEYLASVITK